ncbi:ANR family transcriptional regulator [Enterobacter ludwigii]|uniref:ANR family transcriptional regulator n=1 Tax=Enterobacter ludwigii TaxID=299767 RepID=UPI001BD2B8F2|nr:ANR family transcriptional regulator [Enterobacter hormaechei]
MTTLSIHPESDNAPVNDVIEQMTSTRALYRQLTAAAAALERAGIYPEAAEQWRQAWQLAPGAKSRFWCEVRQARCLREIPREVHSYGRGSGKRARKVASAEPLG